MLGRYKIRIIKTWDFELDGKSKEDVEQQMLYIMNQTKILDLPEVKKRLRWKIKKSGLLLQYLELLLILNIKDTTVDIKKK